MSTPEQPAAGPAAAYVRVSTPQQGHELQEHEITRCAAARGDRITVTYAEKASGGSLARPELARLRRDAKAGRLPPRLYVWALDRLTRTGIVDTVALVRELRRHGVEVISVSDPFDVEGPAGELVLAVMAWAAEQELRRQQQRRAAARARLEAEGRSWGRPPRVAHDDPRWADAERMRVKERRTIRAISIALKIPRATLARGLALRLSQKSGAAEPAAA